MMCNRLKLNYSSAIIAVSAVLALLPMATAAPDEGMWTFDNLPLQVLREKYGFEPTAAWLEHVRLASVRFNNGGSGSFVSPNGLVMTNHHVAVDQLQKVSKLASDYVAAGFYAATPADELHCPDLELNVLQSFENVTVRVKAGIKPGMSQPPALKAIQAAIAQITKESMEKTGLRSEIVNLYHGGEYWLYRYKKYTDVRLVFAPERQAAYFGGDEDNFTYPRYDLDVAFFRVYENGRPVQSAHYLKWNNASAARDELVFVSGNPGSTDRLLTQAQLLYQRDQYYPLVLKYLTARIAVLQQYAKTGPEQERRAQVKIFSLGNSQKALSGEYAGLLDQELMKAHKNREEELKNAIAANPGWLEDYGSAWETIKQVTGVQAANFEKDFFHQLRGSQLASTALAIVQYVAEVTKPDAERLEGYHESQLPALRFQLLSPTPFYLDMEEAILAGTLQSALEALGPDDVFIRKALAGRSPQATAQALFSGTRLDQLDYRKQLFNGGKQAVAASHDSLIVLARRLDPLLREWNEWQRDHVESVLTAATEKIAKARFAVYGRHTYPDATFTLRLSFGTVKGYPMNGTIAPHTTTLYGLFDRSLSFEQAGDFALPPRFWMRKDSLDLSTPVNFVSTCDIIGGNSGSPVINRNAELVGLIFDGNIESLPGSFFYDESKNRAVAVQSTYIMAGLRKLYDAWLLADEIAGNKAFGTN